MKTFVTLLAKSFAIAAVLCSVGLMANFAADNPVPLIYSPPQTVELFGVKVPLIDEKLAFKFFNEPTTLFIDSRKYADYARSHVEGAIHLSPDGVESKFQLLDGMISQDSRIILYCYGPECDMAERVALFLAQLGYKEMMIMTAGFAKWEKSDYPVKGVPFKESDDSKSDGPKKNYQSDEKTYVLFKCLCSLTKPRKAS